MKSSHLIHNHFSPGLFQTENMKLSFIKMQLKTVLLYFAVFAVVMAGKSEDSSSEEENSSNDSDSSESTTRDSSDDSDSDSSESLEATNPLEATTTRDSRTNPLEATTTRDSRTDPLEATTTRDSRTNPNLDSSESLKATTTRDATAASVSTFGETVTVSESTTPALVVTSRETIAVTTAAPTSRRTTKAPVDKKKKEREEARKRAATIVGNYILKTDPDNDNYDYYLKAMKYDAETRREVRMTKKVMVSLKKLSTTHWDLKHSTKDKTRQIIFQSGKELVIRLLDGRKKNATITLDEKEKKISSLIKMEEFNATQEVTFLETGFSVTFTAKDESATLEFQRQNPFENFVDDVSNVFKNIFRG